MLTKRERIQMIEEAIALVTEAQSVVIDAIQDTPQEHHFRAYNGYGFDQLLGNGNPYDPSLESLLEDEDDFIDPAGGSGLHSHI